MKPSFNLVKVIMNTIPAEGHQIIDDVYMNYYFVDQSLPLVITFGSLGAWVSRSDAESGSSKSWGFKYILSKGVNVLSFSCIDSPNWYRSETFHKYLKKLSLQIKSFPIRLGYGSSMGGFGVSSFANLLNIDEVLLLNPISTLNIELVPQENRFTKAREQFDWNDDYMDGAEMEASGYIVYDPLYKIDALHATRYKNLKTLRFPGVGHQIPKHLKEINLLNKLVTSFLKGAVDEHDFFITLRDRRKYQHYYEWLLSKQNIHNTTNRSIVIKKAQKDQSFVAAGLEEYKKEIVILKELIPQLEFVDYDLSILLNDILENTIKENSYIFLGQGVELFRDSAVKHEVSNLEISYKLMSLAKLIKPRGPFIIKKCIEYKKRIKVNF
jgi:hypothetical protein